MKIGDLTTGSKLNEYTAWLNPLNYSPMSLFVTGVAIAIIYKYRPTGEAQKVAKLTGAGAKGSENPPPLGGADNNVNPPPGGGEQKQLPKQKVIDLSSLPGSGKSSVKNESDVEKKKGAKTEKKPLLPTPDLEVLKATKQVQFEEKEGKEKEEADAPPELEPVVQNDYQTPLIKIRKTLAQTPGTSKADRKELRDNARGTVLAALKTSELKAIFHFVLAQQLKSLGSYDEAITEIENGRIILGKENSELLEPLILLKGQCKEAATAKSLNVFNTSKVGKLFKETGVVNPNQEDLSDFSKYQEYEKLAQALNDELRADLYYIFACNLMDADLFEDASKVNKEASKFTNDGTNKELLQRLRDQSKACGLLVKQQEELKNAHKVIEEQNAEIERLKVGELFEIRKMQDQLYQKLCELEAQRRNEMSDIAALNMQLLKSDATNGQTAKIEAQIKEKEAVIAKIEEEVVQLAPPPPAPPPPPEDFVGVNRGVALALDDNELTKGLGGLKKAQARRPTAKSVAKEVEEQANQAPTVTQKLNAQKKQAGKDAVSVVRSLNLDLAPKDTEEKKTGEK